jgi:hypothetical protein
MGNKSGICVYNWHSHTCTCPVNQVIFYMYFVEDFLVKLYVIPTHLVIL